LKDNQGNGIKTGDILFYSERPFSNYADSLVEVYELNGSQRVRHIVSNGFGRYVPICCNSEQDLDLDAYGWSTIGKQTDIAKELTLIPDLTAEQATVEYAHKHYPLDRIDEDSALN